MLRVARTCAPPFRAKPREAPMVLADFAADARRSLAALGKAMQVDPGSRSAWFQLCTAVWAPLRVLGR